jgi:hypothetical protein
MLADEKPSLTTTGRTSILRHSFRISKQPSRNSSMNSTTGQRFFKLHRPDEHREGNSLDCYDRMEKIYRNTTLTPKDANNIPHNRKLLRNMLKRLESRGESFYRFGFRSFERQNNLMVLQDILNVPFACNDSCVVSRSVVA